MCPQIQKLADRSDVIPEVPKCSKIQIFRGSSPDPTEGAYSASPEPLADGEGARSHVSTSCYRFLPRTPPPLSALRSSFIRVSGSNLLQSWQPY